MELHPTLAALIAQMRAADALAISELPLTEARARSAAARTAFGAGPDVPLVEDRQIRHAGHTVPCRLYKPERPRGLCVHFHGGGWVMGGLDEFDAFVRTFAVRTNCAILAVDYRLAPEHPFPAALDAAATAIGWAGEEGVRELGLRPGIVLLGDSAGGNIAAVAAIEQAQRVEILLQLLFYPVVDADFSRPSYGSYSDGYLLTRRDMEYFFSHYAGTTALSEPRIAVLRHAGIGAAPPAWIAVVGHDVLADDGRAYGRALAAAGVKVELREYPDLMHGFSRLYAMVESADHAVDDAAAAVIRPFDRRARTTS